ncbi:MAG: lipid II flippase MurJ, partial [Pseudomonadales bacterium]
MNGEAQGGLGRRSAVVGAMTSLSRVLGLLRDMVLAQLLGAQPAADAFYVAFKIPNFFRRMFAEGAFSQGFVPVLTAARQSDPPEAVQRLVAAVAGALGLLLLVLTASAMIFSEAVIGVFAPGLGADPRGALAAELLVLTAPYLFFISLTALAAGVQNVHGTFARPAITPIWLNICLLAAAWGLAPWLGRPALALAWGVLLAGIVQFLFQLPALARLGYLRWPRLELSHPGVRRIGV